MAGTRNEEFVHVDLSEVQARIDAAQKRQETQTWQDDDAVEYTKQRKVRAKRLNDALRYFSTGRKLTDIDTLAMLVENKFPFGITENNLENPYFVAFDAALTLESDFNESSSHEEKLLAINKYISQLESMPTCIARITINIAISAALGVLAGTLIAMSAPVSLPIIIAAAIGAAVVVYLAANTLSKLTLFAPQFFAEQIASQALDVQRSYYDSPDEVKSAKVGFTFRRIFS